MARIDRQKRALGGAVKRTKPSRAATLLVGSKRVAGRVLDFGCGFGFDAGHFGWDAYDPYYRPAEPIGEYDTVVCIHVLNALTRNNRAKAIARIRLLLADRGVAFLAVPRDLPLRGKLSVGHRIQNYVVFTLPSLFSDDRLKIYEMSKHSQFEDKTLDYVSRRDQSR